MGFWGFGVFHKTYFRELVLGFWPDRNQTSAARFSGVRMSIIIKKKWKFGLTVPKGRQNVWSGRSPFCLIGYNSWTERDFCTKLSTRMYELILWSREKGRGDWPLGGAITVKRVSKWCISMANPMKWLKAAILLSDLHTTSQNRACACVTWS